MSDTDTRSVAEIMAESTSYFILPHYAAEACEALGIDPDMDVDTLRRRLLWGERVEQCERSEWPHGAWPYDYHDVLTPCPTPPGGHSGKEYADELYAWLTRPETPE